MRAAFRYCAALLSFVVSTSAACTVDLIGQTSIIDGDLENHGTRVRQWGIGAPRELPALRGEDSLLRTARFGGGKCGPIENTYLQKLSLSVRTRVADHLGVTAPRVALSGIQVAATLPS